MESRCPRRSGWSRVTFWMVASDLTVPDRTRKSEMLPAYGSATVFQIQSASGALSVATRVASLPAAAAVMGAFGLVGALGFIRWVPRFVPRTRINRDPEGPDGGPDDRDDPA